MAVVTRLRELLRQKKGDEAVSFLMTTAMLVLIFAVLISALIYIMQYYNASYICRRVVRGIEVSGEYDEAETRNIISAMANSAWRTSMFRLMPCTSAAAEFSSGRRSTRRSRRLYDHDSGGRERSITVTLPIR
jgi:hypothetical protein